MQEKSQRLQELENLVDEKTNEVVNIQEKNYPLGNRDFLPKDDHDRVISIDDEVKVLSSEYIRIFNSMSFSEKKKYNFRNIGASYYKLTHKNEGLKPIESENESEIQLILNNAYNFGKEAIDKLISPIKPEEKKKNQQILNCCQTIFNSHPLGKSYIEKLIRYEQRKFQNRQVKDDMADYSKLIEQTKRLANEYEKAIENGASEEEIQVFNDTFEDAFKKEEILLEFVPEEMINGNKFNLHLLKENAENKNNSKRKPQI